MTLITKCIIGGLLCAFTALPGMAIESTATESQLDYERSIKAVVRHKLYYKPGRVELMMTSGIMPYDSLTNHYMAGGRLNWHFSDHFGWEVLDFQFAFPSVTGFTNNLVANKQISNLQTIKLKKTAATGLLLSPAYGKIRFFGRAVLYLDFYFVFGLGFAEAEILKVSNNGTANPNQDILRTAWDPMFHFGFGLKIFFLKSMGLIIDMRDYVISSPTYGTTSMKSNFSVFLGLSFFIPTFG